MRPRIKQAELVYGHGEGNDYRPSWACQQRFLNEEHARIWEATKDLPGWQDAADSQKLYEMAFHNGAVILEIGVYGGRSAVVEIKGALAARSKTPPQYYGVDVDPAFLGRTWPTIKKAGVDSYCLLYHGNVQQFLHSLPIVPTMVFLDGDHSYEGVRTDLETLRWTLAPGTLILCHDYAGIEGVRRAVGEAIRTPHFEMMGLFAGSILVRTTAACTSTPCGLPPTEFVRLSAQLKQRYEKNLATALHTPVEDLCAPMRGHLMRPCRVENDRGPWPYARPTERPLPSTLPNGQPWPKISIVTPSFNQGCFLEETILSVLNQGYPNLEYIVIDGGSTDESVDILNKYGSRLAFWTSEKDRGQCHAINKGLARATGEILTWLNSDDRLAPGALAAAALAFHTSDADLVSGLCQLLQHDRLIGTHLTSCADGPLPLNALLNQEQAWDFGQFFYQPEVFFKRELWERAGAQLDESLHFSMDYELWLRFAQAGARLKILGVPLAQYRIHEAQKTFHAENFRPELRGVRERFLQGRPCALPPLPPTTKDRLQIALLNDFGFRWGAGIAHQRLGQALTQAGHQVHAVAAARCQITDPKQARALVPELVRRVRALQPDVVLVGNIHGARLDPSLIGQLAAEWPTVFVAHDTWILTGRCAYTGSCEKYLDCCDETCPTATEYPALVPDAIKPAWQAKQDLLHRTPGLVIAADSAWLKDKAIATQQATAAPGAVSPTPIRRIRYGLPLDIFKPRDPQRCREEIGLPHDKFILLFSCTNFADARKGTSHLIEALLRLRLPDLVPVCVGTGASQLSRQLPDLITIEYLSDPLRQALLYSAADLFVGPSLEEAFGQVFIEAAACGTPCVAYPVDGVPEAVVDGICGRLASAVRPEALAETLQQLYFQPELRHSLGGWGLRYVRGEFSFEASAHSLNLVLGEVLALHGVHLVPNLVFPAIAPKFLSQVDYVQRPSAGEESPSPPRNESSAEVDYRQWNLEAFFQQQLDEYRGSAFPWVLHPGAWLARFNRNAARKARHDE